MSENKKSGWWRNGSLWVAILSLIVATLAYKGSQESAIATAKSLEIATRPFVGARGIFTNDNRKGVLQAGLIITNFGTVPAYEFEIEEWLTYVDDRLTPLRKGPERTQKLILFPNTPTSVLAVYRKDARADILSGKSELTYKLVVSYKSPDNRFYRYSVRGYYDPLRDAGIPVEVSERILE